MSSQPPDHKLELENQFILRLPPTQAEALRQAVRSGEPLAKRLSVKFEADIRHGAVKFDQTSMAARLYDLPTIIESYKTLDRKNFYKTADISQILICKEETQPSDNGDLDEASRRAKYDEIFASTSGLGKREFLFPHGITPPLKNVRKRRFRKTLKKKYVDFSEIEKEVKRLFKFDCEAIDSRYEIVEESKADKAPTNAFGTDNAPSPMDGGPAGMQSAENSQNIDIHELLGEDTSSSDESDSDEDDEDDFEMDQDNVNDNDEENVDDEEMEEVVSGQQDQLLSVPGPDIAEEIAAASDLISKNDDTEEKRQELVKELNKIRERIWSQREEMENLENPALRARLQQVLDSLHAQEEEIKKNIESLPG